ncbi:MAG: nuclease [Bacteroidetes bacterium 4572_114]|nr:MAG: nuclease [Bacteroidetes bacterium 4572_114]
MDRYIILDLKEWATKERRKPLLLRGARQVGKTWLVESLAKELFKNLIKVDFEEKPDLISLFDGDLDPEKICSELEIRMGQHIIESESLVFFDEIQICPRAIMSLRYFYEKKPGLHVIAAGSLLEFVYSEISFPVGRIQTMEVFPMDFSEFLLAQGNNKAAGLCRQPISNVSEPIHNYLISQLRTYWLVGGMPECVKVYSETKSIKTATEVQDEIIETYKLDFNKYKPKTDINCLNTVFSGLAAKVGQQIKYTTFSKDYTIPTIKKAFESLLKARIATKIKAVSSPGMPLEINASERKFKTVFLDIGLMNRVIGIDYSEALNHDNLLSIYRGQLAEQFVGQEFASSGKNQLYYWARDAKNSNAEIDFLFHKAGDFIPVEVKDGPSGKLRSLHHFRSSYQPSYSVVFHAGKMGRLKDENIVFLPLYFANSFAIWGINQL